MKGLEIAYDVTTELEYFWDYPPIYNHPKETEKAVSVLETNGLGDYLTKVSDVPPSNGAEDFGQYLLKIPGSFLNVGCMPDGEEYFMNHHPKFDLNEKALLIAAKSVGDITLYALEN